VEFFNRSQQLACRCVFILLICCGVQIQAVDLIC
jgi:hypothetical protein